MITKKIINPQNDSLIRQLYSFYCAFKGMTPNEKATFDLSKLNWLFPLLVLPISAHIQKTKSEFVPPQNSKVNSYLEIVRFPNGTSSVSKFQKLKNYIPIAVLRRNNDVREKEKLESCFSEMIYKILKPTVATQNAVYYPLLELTTNIFDHSKRDEGYIFAQYYPKKNFLDLCIVDCGRGLACAYKEEKGLNFTDQEAIKQVLVGHSTKPDIERGYGVRTSKRVVCEGLGGSFILLSGDSALFSSKNEEKIISLPDFCWQGVVISYRIPQPTKPVDITQYIEG